jgi:hypothetical protein
MQWDETYIKLEIELGREPTSEEVQVRLLANIFKD